MFELELEEARNLVVDTNESISNFFSIDFSSAKRVEAVEEILAKSSLLIAYLIQLRYMALMQQNDCPQSTKIILNNLLAELKVQLDAFKTISYNFSAMLYSCRDRVKEDNSVK